MPPRAVSELFTRSFVPFYNADALRYTLEVLQQVSDAVAYLEVSLQPRGVIQVSEPRQIFRGWMFASSPAVNGLQHPIYDAWIVGCKA